MSNTFNIHQAKTQLSKLVDMASKGERIVIAKAGKPTALLVPLEYSAREPGLFKGMIEGSASILDPLPGATLDEWEGGQNAVST